ncbi:MAG: hypothetical protein ACI4F5_01515 [Acutalibacteraceae bacterium]
MNTKRLFEKYGQKATLSVGGETVKNYDFRAFVQPLRYKNKLYLRGKFTEIGKNRQDYYLYIGPPDIDISEVDGSKTRLYIGQEEYLAYRTEKHKLADDTVYFWAIIRPVTPETEENTDTDDETEAVG